MKSRKKALVALAALAISFLLAGAAFAHTPICMACLNDDGTVTCEGGFSDGSSAAGVKMTVRTPDGKILIEGVMDEFSEFTFEKPQVPFEVEFNAGPGHVILIKGEDIK